MPVEEAEPPVRVRLTALAEQGVQVVAAAEGGELG
jgi:hypothetical protein